MRSVLIASAVAIVLLPLARGVPAQSRKPRSAPSPNVRVLDDRAAALEAEYLRGLYELADGYEQAGHIDKARQVLQQILVKQPDSEQARAKLKQFDEAVFEQNSHTVEIDVARGWTPTNVLVAKDAPIRFSADGTYRFIVNEQVTADGFAKGDVLRDMVPGIPAGALMGMVLPPPKPDQREPPAPGAPFTIGSAGEVRPSESGMLLLRVNLPTGHKSVGQLKVTIRGNFRRAG